MSDISATLIPLNHKIYQHYKSISRAYSVGGQEFCFDEKTLPVIKSFQNFQVREDDVFVLSFPKTGTVPYCTTWMQEIVYLLLNDVDFKKANATIRDDVIPYGDFDMASLEFANNLPSPRLIKLHLHLLSFLPAAMLTTKCKDQGKVIEEMAEFLNKSVSKNEIKMIADHCKFDNMKQNPAANRTGFQQEQAINNDFVFMRKGIVGNWKTEMSLELVTKIDKWIIENTADCPDLREIFF
uniref:Sulfotransferase domain-containing protein n=1 Tax=Strigamia maritima TaxID=126957 RepID=T1II80_STRMM